MFGKKKTEEQSIDIKEFQTMLKDVDKYLIPSSNFPQEVQILTTSREIKHLKNQIWKFSHKY
jgi:hypothetical protein